MRLSRDVFVEGQRERGDVCGIGGELKKRVTHEGQVDGLIHHSYVVNFERDQAAGSDGVACVGGVEKAGKDNFTVAFCAFDGYGNRWGEVEISQEAEGGETVTQAVDEGKFDMESGEVGNGVYTFIADVMVDGGFDDYRILGGGDAEAGVGGSQNRVLRRD